MVPNRYVPELLQFRELYVEVKIVQAFVQRMLDVRVVPKPCTTDGRSKAEVDAGPIDFGRLGF
jgi:hypothetical protein